MCTFLLYALYLFFVEMYLFYEEGWCFYHIVLYLDTFYGVTGMCFVYTFLYYYFQIFLFIENV